MSVGGDPMTVVYPAVGVQDSYVGQLRTRRWRFFVGTCREALLLFSPPGILTRFSSPVLIYRLLIGILLQLHCFLPEYLLQDLYFLLLLQRDQHA